jgi:hypothetical protein
VTGEEERSVPRVYVLGGNSSTLAFVSDMRVQRGQMTAWLAPLAWTPVGVVLGEGWQRVAIAADNVAGWVDQTFPAEDERSFVASLHDLDLLMRIGWGDDPPEKLHEGTVVNIDDVPEDVIDALARPPEILTQCAVCRRTCVRDHFVWNDRQLCAWDYHTSVFGRRGPWHSGSYEERHFETIPAAMYIAGALLDELHVDPILAISGLADATAHRLLNMTIEAENGGCAYLAVRTEGGYTLLRERRS